MCKAFMQPLMFLAINGTEKESGESDVNTDTEEKMIRKDRKVKEHL